MLSNIHAAVKCLHIALSKKPSHEQISVCLYHNLVCCYTNIVCLYTNYVQFFKCVMKIKKTNFYAVCLHPFSSALLYF